MARKGQGTLSGKEGCSFVKIMTISVENSGVLLDLSVEFKV